jgi:hypothetical protein
MTSLVFTLFFLSPFLIVMYAAYLAAEHFGGSSAFRTWIKFRIARWQIRAERRRTIAKMRRISAELNGIRWPN